MSNSSDEKLSLLDRVGVFVLFGLWDFYDGIMYEKQKSASLKKYQAVLDWVKTQTIPLDTDCELKLPRRLATITRRGTVFALHTADGRYCILMKTWVSPGRDNFYGTFYCDKPLFESDFLPYEAYGIPCIRIAGEYRCLDLNGEENYRPGFRQLYVTKRHSDQLFEVDYTLD